MKIEEFLPAKCFSTNEADLLVYSRDASAFEGKCSMVIWPETVEQLVQIVQYGRRSGNHFTIRGAATSTMGGCVPANSIVIDLAKMQKVLSVAKDYVEVEAGAVLDELNSQLVRRRIPVKPVEHSVCTIGGMIATNTMGLDSFYGRMRNWVLELGVVDGTGKKLRVSGEDLDNFVGKEGITGIIYQAKLRIVPKHNARTISLFKFNTLKAMMDKVEELRKNKAVISIGYYDEYISKLLQLEEVFHIVAEFDNDEGLIKSYEEIEKLDELRERMHHVLVRRKFSEIEDPSVPYENTAKFLHWLRKYKVPCYGEIMSGIFHPCFKEYSNLPTEMMKIVAKLQGKNMQLFPKGIKRKHRLLSDEKNFLKKLKQKYDTQNIMNRGVLIE